MRAAAGQVRYLRVVSTMTDLIAFSRSGGLSSDDSDVLLVDVDGRGLRKLTDGFSTSSPAWSPDGERIAFVHDDIIYSIGVDGEDLRQLTDVDSRGDLPSWSPDGTRIAYRAWGGDGIYLVDADGTNLEKIVDHDFGYSPPAWSPDGTRIAFTGEARREAQVDTALPTRTRNGVVGLFASSRIPTAIFIVDVESREVHKITEGSDPVWSPDGMRIAFTNRDGYFYDSDLWMIDVDGSEPEQLTANDYRDQSPVWSPDSRSILFHRSARGLMVIDVDSKALR